MFGERVSLMNENISVDNQELVEAKPRDIRTGGLPDPQDTGRDGGAEGDQQEDHQIRHEVFLKL